MAPNTNANSLVKRGRHLTGPSKGPRPFDHAKQPPCTSTRNDHDGRHEDARPPATRAARSGRFSRGGREARGKHHVWQDCWARQGSRPSVGWLRCCHAAAHASVRVRSAAGTGVARAGALTMHPLRLPITAHVETTRSPRFHAFVMTDDTDRQRGPHHEGGAIQGLQSAVEQHGLRAGMPLEVYHTLDNGALPLLKPCASSAALHTCVCCTSARPAGS